MTDYRLDGLSTRTFEHLVQALALDSIASTVTPFGDGPDGGREATFNGLTNYGPVGSPWDGYGVIQAKFLQRPKSTKSDGEWIVRELAKELNKYQRRRRGTTLDYYIIATNVTLSAVEASGAKDSVINLLEKFAARNRLKDFDIWDYDKLRILIDANESIRRAYAAWITTGDVLMQLSDWLTEHRPDYHRLVANYLQKELLSDQYAKLEQAGHTADEAIPLAQVFVDLPIANRLYAVESNLYHDLPNLVSFVIEQAANRLIQSAIADKLAGSQEPPPGRFVLIGGPGQGKTTLGQYLCQIFRTSILQDVPWNLLDPEVRRVIGTFESMFKSGALTRPGARRLPLRVVLSGFASALAEKKTTSLVAYLADGFSKRTNSTLTAQQFQALIVEYPSLLVLDGLDEVPASSNREQVLAAVQDFAIDVTSCGMDMLILATSRPQGYNEDFSPRAYDHRWLVPLPAKKALEYGTKLAQVRFAGDSDRVEKIVGRLRRASAAPATARIMRSPLQVTILTLLVDRRGQLPQERWALFDEYYTLIYQRETERDIPAAAILREKKDDIDAVHRLVGLLLQVESEKSGRTDARLTTAQFSKIVENYLISEGNEGSVLIKLRDAIIEGAAYRLVFLVGLESGEVGFEIRSLQEFMAAEGLVDADDGLVQSRLRAVAGNSNWRNVILFAAGKVFADRRYLRDTVESICIELNEDISDHASRLVFAGSELALDLLEDGPVARQPAKNRSLTRLALKLLELDGSTWPRRLAGICQDTTCDIFEEELSRAFGSPESKARSNAWVCLAALMEGGTGHNWTSLVARALAGSPPDADAVVEMMASSPDPVPELLTDLMAKILPAINPANIRAAGYRNARVYVRRGVPRSRFAKFDWLDAAWYAVSLMSNNDRSKTLKIVDSDTSRSLGDAYLRRISSPRSSRLGSMAGFPAECHACWELTKQIAIFEDAPAKGRLVEILRTASKIETSETAFLNVPSFASWPLVECLLMGAGDIGWTILIEAAESGLLGDRADWERWENSWIAEGLKLEDIHLGISHILETGASRPWFPIKACEVRFTGARWLDMPFVGKVMSDATNPLKQELVLAIAVSYASRPRNQRVEELSPVLVDAFLEVAHSSSWLTLVALMDDTKWSPPLNELWASAISKGAQKSSLMARYTRRNSITPWLISAFREFPHHYGLLAAIVQLEAFGKLTGDDIYCISRLPLEGAPTVIRLSRAIILLRAGRTLCDVKSDVDVILKDGHVDIAPLFHALGNEDMPVDRQISDLLAIWELVVSSPARKTLVLSVLRDSLQRRQSDLIDERRWVELGFMASLREVMRSANP